MFDHPYATIEQAAKYLGYNPDTLRILVELGIGPRKCPPRGWRCFAVSDIKYFRKWLPASPNELLPKGSKNPLFALHDDGRWWPRVTYEEALANGKHRYFEGTICEAGHTVKRLTKSRKCVDCCAIAAGRPSTRDKLAKNQKPH